MGLFGGVSFLAGGASAPAVAVPVANVSVSPASASEGNSGTNTRTVTVSLSDVAPVGGSSVDWAVTGVGANPVTAGDFSGGVLPSGTITVTAGNTSGTGTITITGDATVEADELGRVTISNPTNCTLGTTTADFTIVNDDSAGGVVSAPFANVQADGWRANFGSAQTLGVMDAPFTVDSPGFDSTGTAVTVRRTVYVRKNMRLPYPNGSTALDTQFALGEYVYQDDVLHGGAVNNSAETSPAPFGKWLTIDQRIVGNSVSVSSIWCHMDARRAALIAAVKYIVRVGGVEVASATVATATLTSFTGWARQVPAFNHTFDISSSVSDLADFTIDALAYPHLGSVATGSVFDSATKTLHYETRTQRFKKHVAKADSPWIAVVNRDGAKTVNSISYGAGSSGGVISQNANTARATPFDTYAGALAALSASASTGNLVDGCEIWLASSLPLSYSANPFNSGSSGTPRNSAGYALKVKRDPNITGIVVESMSGRTYFTGTRATGLDAYAIHFEDVSFQRVSGSGQLELGGGSTGALVDFTLINCTGVATGGNIRGGNARDLTFWGGSYTSVGTMFDAYTGGRTRLMGVTAAALSGATRPYETNCVVGCELTYFSISAGSSARGSFSDSVIAYNRFMSAFVSGDIIVTMASGATTRDVGVFGNVFEHNGAGDRIMRISGDGNSNSTDHICIFGNTQANYPGNNGGNNNAYDENGSVGRTHRRWAVKGNIMGPMPSKGDGFINDGARVGNWPYSWGVNRRDNYIKDLTGFACEDIGRGSVQSTGVTLDPLWVNYQAGPGGLGGGDYHLQSGSPCKAFVTDAVLSHDIDGVARPASGDSAGAYV